MTYYLVVASTDVILSSGEEDRLPPKLQVETGRRLRDVRDIERCLQPVSVAAILGGSASYGRFINVKGGTDSSDLDILLVVQDWDGAREAFAALSRLDMVGDESIDAAVSRVNELGASRHAPDSVVINSLHQTGKSGEQKDGMDISLIAFYPDQEKIEFSGANNPLYMIRNNELFEYKGDKMPVGIHDKMNTLFTTTEIKTQKNDRFSFVF